MSDCDVVLGIVFGALRIAEQFDDVAISEGSIRLSVGSGFFVLRIESKPESTAGFQP